MDPELKIKRFDRTDSPDTVILLRPPRSRENGSVFAQKNISEPLIFACKIARSVVK